MAGANVRNYTSNEKSSFFSLEDVDDEEFLKNSRGSKYAVGEGGSSRRYGGGENGVLEERRLQLLREKERIEAESLESTMRSLRLLNESETVGTATAQELQKQREQLERTESRLDKINSNLRYTQKKIDGLKSVFGSIKNYLTKKSDAPGALKDGNEGNSWRKDVAAFNKRGDEEESETRGVHPGMKVRGVEGEPLECLGMSERIDENLDQICYSVKNIKGLALNLGQEIESQNELMDRILDKADKADVTLKKQNKEMDKLMKK